MLLLNQKLTFGTSLFALLVLTVSFSSFSYAQENTSTSVSPIDATTGIEKTTLTFDVPADNTYPWGFIEGTIQNHVPHNPVIIQIFDNDDLDVNGNDVGAVHFAQTSVNADGSYQYRFRISDNQDGDIVNFYEGQYTVKIFKVVYLNSELNEA